MASKVDLPDFLRAWLDSWGSKMLRQMRQAVQDLDIKLPWPKFCSISPSSSGSPGSSGSAALRVGTDCSGLEAPVHALRALEIPHIHVFSCENNLAARSMIEANCKPRVFFEDVLKSCEDAAPFCHLYVAGFSCKPFSTLHYKSKLLEERDASIFRAVVRRISTLRPPCFVLENVEGIQRVMKDITSQLKACGYLVVHKLMDPASLGEPLLRPRFYFLGLRKDVACVNQACAEQVVDQLWSAALKDGERVSLLQRLLPNNHPLVHACQLQRKERWTKAASAGFPDPSCRTKWKTKHAAIEMAPGERHCVPACTADKLFLHLPRQRDLWKKLSQKWVGQANRLTCDVSQSLGRARDRVDGKVPTITPRSHLIVAEVQRALVPHEMLLLHGFPLHRMVVPPTIKGVDLQSMAGNTMHIPVVGAAMVMTLLLVDWRLPSAHRSGAASLGSTVVQTVPARPAPFMSKEKMGELEAKLRARFFSLMPSVASGGKKGRTSRKQKVAKTVVNKKSCKKKLWHLHGTRWA
eukprot:s3667_g7.t1